LVAHLDSLYGGGIADQGPVTPSRRVYGTSFDGPTGIEVFTIDFPRVPFPISLLLSQKAMSDYKLLFRHLFFTKHVERRLIGVWRDHQLLKKLDALRGLLGPTFLLRQRMLHFMQNLIYYMVFEVVESHWMDMRNAIDDKSWGQYGRSDKQQTVDDILEVHNNFLKRTLEACLLTNSDLIRSLTKLMNTCLLFTDQMKRFMDTTKIVSFFFFRVEALPAASRRH
jgi:gamma-tubulin complex component 2